MISIFNKEKSKWHLGDSTGHIIKLHNNFFIPITREGRAECVQTSCACKCPQPHFQSLISAALKYTRCVTKPQSFFATAVGKIPVDFRGLDNIQEATALGTAETMRHSQVKNLLLPGLVSGALIPAPVYTALRHCRSLPDVTTTGIPYTQGNHIICTMGLRCQVPGIQRPHLCLCTHSSVAWFGLQPTGLALHVAATHHQKPLHADKQQVE